MEQPRDARRLRENCHLMEPDELTPQERWERIIELLAEMCLAPESEPDDTSSPS